MSTSYTREEIEAEIPLLEGTYFRDMRAAAMLKQLLAEVDELTKDRTRMHESYKTLLNEAAVMRRQNEEYRDKLLARVLKDEARR